MSLYRSSSLPLDGFFAGRSSHSLNIAQRAAVAFAGSLFVALCAHIAMPLPFTPVPFTLQPFAVLLVGMLLGPATGFAAMVMYLCEGAAGFPVFTPAGLPGIARLIGPSGGYLFAYPVAALLAGAIPRLFKHKNRFAPMALAGAVAMIVVYTCGALWFSATLHLPLGATLSGAILPFAAFDVVKICAAAGIASTCSRQFE